MENIKIYAKLIHKEDAMILCGFKNKQDRIIFDILTSVSGIGTKVAFALLDEFETNDLIKGTYKKKEFITSNLAVYKAKSSLGFFGRVYMFELKNKFDKKTTIHLYNKEKNISNLKVFEEEKVKGYNFDVYSALEEKDLKKLLNQKVIDILNSVELNENVREVACVIENHQLTVFSDFSENLVNIPTDKKIDKKVFETLKKDLNMVLSLVDAIK